jgi:hypothetical protein
LNPVLLSSRIAPLPETDAFDHRSRQRARIAAIVGLVGKIDP